MHLSVITISVVIVGAMIYCLIAWIALRRLFGSVAGLLIGQFVRRTSIRVVLRSGRVTSWHVLIASRQVGLDQVRWLTVAERVARICVIVLDMCVRGRLLFLLVGR